MRKWTEILWTVRLEEEGEMDRGTVRGRKSNAPPNVKLASHSRQNVSVLHLQHFASHVLLLQQFVLTNLTIITIMVSPRG